VTVSAKGFNISTVGLILMIVGGVGFVLSLLYMTMWDRHERVAASRTVAYDDPDYRGARRVP
jgi:hypothetical protein